MQSKHNLFKYSLKEAIINLIKIKSSDQMFTACVLVPNCLFKRVPNCLVSPCMYVVMSENRFLRFLPFRLFRVSHSMKCQNMMGRPFVFERGT
jgi:hypothetical protein